MENFIEKLMSISSDQELRDIISQKGKPQKIIPGIIYEDNDNEKLLIGQYNK